MKVYVAFFQQLLLEHHAIRGLFSSYDLAKQALQEYCPYDKDLEVHPYKIIELRVDEEISTSPEQVLLTGEELAILREKYWKSLQKKDD